MKPSRLWMIAITLVCGMLLAACSADDNPAVEPTTELLNDGAGLSAAVEAASHGDLQIIVLEKQGILGGTAIGAHLMKKDCRSGGCNELPIETLRLIRKRK